LQTIRVQGEKPRELDELLGQRGEDEDETVPSLNIPPELQISCREMIRF
jgi:hypothetical protein